MCKIFSKISLIYLRNWLINLGVDYPYKVTLDVEGNSLILFVNHWKSKQGPESSRIVYAKALKKALDKLDTGGITGINHILKTNMDSISVDEKILLEQTGNEYLYNLWLEINKKRCWSYNFFGDKNSPDNIIVSKGLYDKKGISYIDNSFD